MAQRDAAFHVARHGARYKPPRAQCTRGHSGHAGRVAHGGRSGRRARLGWAVSRPDLTPQNMTGLDGTGETSRDMTRCGTARRCTTRHDMI